MKFLMKIFPRRIYQKTVNLSGYIQQILSKEDRPLFDDAVEAGNAGALRAAYLMIWLSCAEALKRRFRVAQKRDHLAGRILGEIESKESEHKAVDKLLLDKANNYGFISDSGLNILSHIYEMRCLYGHPYEEAPAREQVSHAAAMIVEHVLSQPVKLRHGYGKQLITSLTEEPSFLDDQRAAVTTFTLDIVARIDDSIHEWLLDTYWERLEPIATDSTMSIFFRRGIWFSHAMLSDIGIDVFDSEGWHERSTKFPKVMVQICSESAMFSEIGIRAQDSVVGLILTEARIQPSRKLPRW